MKMLRGFAKLLKVSRNLNKDLESFGRDDFSALAQQFFLQADCRPWRWQRPRDSRD